MTRDRVSIDRAEMIGEGIDPLVLQNAQLREQARVLAERHSALLRELAEVRFGSQLAREARRAALNLMEDALTARRAQDREIAERRRTELELRASESKYRHLFESIDEGFCIIERIWDSPDGAPDFLMVEVNPAFAAQSGSELTPGRTLREAFAGEPEDWFRAFLAVADTGESSRFERRLVTKGRVVEAYAFRIQEPGPSRVAVLLRDITERKAAEEALREADRRKDEFLATLAHELRNPLAPISNSLQILRLCLGDDPEVGDLCEMMERQTTLMVRLVDDLLEVSRITRGTIELRKEPTELATIVRNAVELTRPLMESLGHRLTVTLPDEPVRLQGDMIRLGQIFGNLLANAAKYTDAGGEILLHADRQGAEVVVKVRDNGIGISPEMLPQVFEMFTQVDRSSGRGRGGLGIGLTLARQLVEMHGGSIEAHSDGPGRGSEFVVRLPVGTPESARSGDSAGERAHARLGQRKVVVVDDNVDAASSLARLLRSLGTDVETANDGRTALALIRRLHPEVVFLDLGMPGMDGIEVARQIREDPGLHGVRLIALTGWGQPGDRSRTREAGFDHHLVKPADVRELHSLLA